MTLEEKILHIDKPSLESTIGLLPSGSNGTVEAFFRDFVVPRFPSKNIIKQWHRVLMDYTEDLSNLSCCVRYGNNGSSKLSAAGEKGYYKLRRGWLTQNTDDNFEYFFADNFFSAFIYKMAIDGFAPANANELRDVFRQHKFPYGFGYKVDKKVNEYKGVVIDVGKQPGFLDNYKLSHVFDAGECFLMNDGSVLGDAELSPQYYPIGHSNDFLMSSDRIRRMHISPDAKKVIVAKFLRFAHPMNYFLTPGKKLHQCKTKVYMNDIGEDPIMIHYVKKYLAAEFSTEYAEFVDKIMWKDGYIGIEYSRPAKRKKKVTSTTVATAPVSAKIATSKPSASPAKSGSKCSRPKANKQLADDFTAFKAFVGTSSASNYCTSIRTIMREMGLRTLADLEVSLSAAIHYCTQRMGSAATKEENKLYSGHRSALRRYEQFLIFLKAHP